MDNEWINRDLYVNKIFLSKEIPSGNYLKRLPVISNQKKIVGMKLTKLVTIFVGESRDRIVGMKIWVNHQKDYLLI